MLFLALPKYVANNVFGRVSSTIVNPVSNTYSSNFLKIYNSPLRHAPHIFIQKPSSFFGTQWSSLHLAQIVFVQALLEPLNVNTYITLTSMLNSKLHIELNDIFPTNAKQMPLRYLNNQLRDYLLLSP